MLKGDFVKKVKEALNLSSMKAADEVVDKFTALVVDLVSSGEEITLGSLGRFMVNERAAVFHDRIDLAGVDRHEHIHVIVI